MPARAVALSLTSTKRDRRPRAARARPRAGRAPSRRAAGRAAPRRRTRPRAAPSRSAVSRCSSPSASTSSRSENSSGARGSRCSSTAAPDRRDLGRRRAAAAADHPRAEVARVRGELGEVLRRRVRVDDAAAGEAREADVRQRGERPPVGRASARAPRAPSGGRCRDSRRSRRRRAGRGARPPRARSRRRASRRPRRRSSARRSAGSRRSHRLDRVDELLEVVERLDHEEVGAAALEDARLLAEELAAHPRGRRLADRPDRAGRLDFRSCPRCSTCRRRYFRRTSSRQNRGRPPRSIRQGTGFLSQVRGMCAASVSTT